jgi:hypothetical protein
MVTAGDKWMRVCDEQLINLRPLPRGCHTSWRPRRVADPRWSHGARCGNRLHGRRCHPRDATRRPTALTASSATHREPRARRIRPRFHRYLLNSLPSHRARRFIHARARYPSLLDI